MNGGMPLANGQPQPPQQQQQAPQNGNWNPQMQQPFMRFQQNEPNHLAQAQPQNGLNKPAYGNNFPDWTSLDPAIVSYRQFSFMNGPNQPAAGDMFLNAQQQQQSQMNQQQNLQPGQGFGHHGLNLQSNLMGQQQQQQQQQANPQLNFSHANWLNNEQSVYMNGLTNGGFPNGFDKFSIPMPPGFQNNVPGNNKQKAECIN